MSDNSGNIFSIYADFNYNIPDPVSHCHCDSTNKSPQISSKYVQGHCRLDNSILRSLLSDIAHMGYYMVHQPSNYHIQLFT